MGMQGTGSGAGEEGALGPGTAPAGHSEHQEQELEGGRMLQIACALDD